MYRSLAFWLSAYVTYQARLDPIFQEADIWLLGPPDQASPVSLERTGNFDGLRTMRVYYERT